jgi:hypothetical protein
MNLFRTVFSAIIFLGCVIVANAQCNTVELSETCPSVIPNGFTFVKSYELEASTNKKIEKSYVFSNGMTYTISTCNSDPNISIKIYDSSRREVGSNFINNKMNSTFGFQCTVTGIYYIDFFFDKASKTCGAAVLAFKR